MIDLCFLDTETLGLDPDAPIWEFAAVRRNGDGTDVRMRFQIQHLPTGWIDTLDEPFRVDYQQRYRPDTALYERDAAIGIEFITRGAVMVCCNPVFDEPRLAQLLRRNRLEPGWHYHPLDSASIAIGYLAGRDELPAPPWKSDGLSAAVGVDPAEHDRHTAAGDVGWLTAQWDRTVWPALRHTLRRQLLEQTCPQCPHEIGQQHTPTGCLLCGCMNGEPPAVPEWLQ